MEVLPLDAAWRASLSANARAIGCTHPLIVNAYKTTDKHPFDVVTFLQRSDDKMMIRMFHTAASEEQALCKFREHLRASDSLKLCLVQTPPPGQEFMEPGVREYVDAETCNRYVHAFVSRS